jgi:hypothetical protein
MDFLQVCINIVYGRGRSGFSYNVGKVTVLALIGVTSQSAIALQDPSKIGSIDFGLRSQKNPVLFTQMLT